MTFYFTYTQKYSDDDELKNYFENKKYLLNAMYVTLYGESDYVMSLRDIVVEGRKIHDKYSVLQNTHLHAHGVERGTQPYGGRGYGASSVSFNGKLIGKATLPQRDMFETLIKSIVSDELLLQEQIDLNKRTQLIIKKDVKKLLKIKNSEHKNISSPDVSNKIFYADTSLLEANEGRFIQIGTSVLYSLLERHNTEFISELSLSNVERVVKLKKLLIEKQDMSEDEF
jgi:hypothetical protein